MDFLYEDKAFSFQTLRTAGYGVYGGAELGEILTTCRGVPEGDEDAWTAEWSATAARVEQIGRKALAEGHRVSAREALLRATNYYRNADFFRRIDPDNDVESKRLDTAGREAFDTAVSLFDVEGRAVEIPYEDSHLHGYLYLTDDSGEPRPTVVYHTGYDGTLEESYFALAAGALRRGYHVLAFDGPGQGRNVREQGMRLRPDWEAAVTPVIDFALEQPEIDNEQIVLAGTSMGGYLAARAAAFEHRIAALILHGGVWSVHEVFSRVADEAAALEGGWEELMATNSHVRWLIRNGRWKFGVETPDEVIAATEPYTVEGIIEQIQCPTLVLEAENDGSFIGQPKRVLEALTCQKDLIFFPEDEGGGEHCHEGAISLWHQQAFDWLDATLQK